MVSARPGTGPHLLLTILKGHLLQSNIFSSLFHNVCVWIAFILVRCGKGGQAVGKVERDCVTCDGEQRHFLSLYFLPYNKGS